MSYSIKQLKAMDPAKISKCSIKHRESVIAELIETAIHAQTAEREACAKVCSDRAMRCELEANQAIENGERDESSALRSTAWQISVCAAAIRARGAQPKD